ncbi:tRNA (adenosine(37)-N6)-dimethylallyltransferase MiaA [Pelagibacteraceae bacterium]|nr:tRNA (adenosine(37)-N6)-dimethylallyltransferase MiaA [Pelagibacteraceae bacterium]MDC0952750.1 tRNA (adenosine(37)-N6)-dimethylallyltransferase MiaA [Pelagibacteraceae bacterium]
MSKKIILIAGPTASGKSKLAIYLAKKLNGVIINADSMQVYKEFSVLSSRPNKKEIKQIKHYLYGFISVKKYFSAGDWLKEVKKKINLCIKKKKIPIVVGGTGLYFNTITNGISKIPNIDLKTRDKVRNLFKKIGFVKFYERLVKLDPKVKNKILPSDAQRAQRAYEVKLKTKKSIFDWIENTKSDFVDFDLRKVFIEIPREELLKKISKRTKQMFMQKCINEVNKFNKIKLRKNLSANKLIGVQEINSYLKNNIDLKQCKELINIKTRQYAKRQNTWARGHMKNWNKVYSKDFSHLLKKTLKVIS